MKFLGAIFIVISCGTVGISLSESLRKRISLIDALYCMLNDFSISIQYTAPTVWQLLDNAYNNREFANVKFLKTFHDNIAQDVPFTELWYDSIRKDFSLKSAEKDILYGLGNSLGKVGCEECISNLHLAMDRLKVLQTQAIEEYSKKGTLFRWLGILIGVAISIMVV
ncbi:MAG: stage III sporulation protein AB [Ruminococcus sp.]|nr:stage III sporulation protein AB [Ruminococcus sp.]